MPSTAALVVLLLTGLVLSAPLHAQWKVVNKVEHINPDTFNGIACADSMHCIAYGYAAYDYPRLKKSTDGGKRWQWLLNEQADLSGQTHVLPLRPASAAFPTPDLMLLSMDKQRMLRSTDAGASWDTIYFDDIPFSWSGGELKMFDEHNGLLIYGAASQVYSTTDGGASWTKTDARALPDEHAYSRTVSILSPSHINILTSNAAHDTSWLYRTSDGGASWSSSPLPAFVNYAFGDFSDALHGWAAGGRNIGTGNEVIVRDIIARTTDGGESWTKVLDTLIHSPEAPTPWDIFGMDAYDAGNVLVVGHRGKILRTRDSGATWRTEQSGINIDDSMSDWSMGLLKAVRFTSATSAIATGWESTITRYDEAGSSVSTRVRRARPAVVPSPVLSTCVIRLADGSPGKRRIRLFDGVGNVVRTLDAADVTLPGGDAFSLAIDMSDLADGIYLIEVDGHEIEKVVKVSR